MIFEFQFKKFGIFHSESTMKVGTDAVLLGAMADLTDSNSMLEIGTGCGIISLMLAQRFPCLVTAVEIDYKSAHQASLNFANGPWRNRMNVIHGDVKNINFERKFDTIVCNPPYFQGDLLSKSIKKNLARHANTLNFDDLCSVSHVLLNDNGSLWLILPKNSFEKFEAQADLYNLYCKKKIQIRNNPSKEISLLILQFVKCKVKLEVQNFVIRDERGLFTHEYTSLTKDFHTWL